MKKLFICLAVLLVLGGCVPTVPKPPAAPALTNDVPEVSLKEYADSQLGFSISYPETSEIKKENQEGYLSLATDTVVGIYLDAALFAGTNLGEAGVIIGTKAGGDASAVCTKPLDQERETDLGEVEINTQKFEKFSRTGAAAGNIYEFIAYRAVLGGKCFEINELLHSGNIKNYPADTVKEFDKAGFSDRLEKIVRSFVFTGAAAGVKDAPQCTCPEGYIKEGEACNPACYYSDPPCMMPSRLCQDN